MGTLARQNEIDQEHFSFAKQRASHINTVLCVAGVKCNRNTEATALADAFGKFHGNEFGHRIGTLQGQVTTAVFMAVCLDELPKAAAVWLPAKIPVSFERSPHHRFMRVDEMANRVEGWPMIRALEINS